MESRVTHAVSTALPGPTRLLSAVTAAAAPLANATRGLSAISMAAGLYKLSLLHARDPSVARRGRAAWLRCSRGGADSLATPTRADLDEYTRASRFASAAYGSVLAYGIMQMGARPRAARAPPQQQHTRLAPSPRYSEGQGSRRESAHRRR